VADAGNARLYFNDTVAVDNFAVFFQLLFLGLTLLVLMISPTYLDRRGIQKGEFYILLVAALTGMMLLVAATNLITIFVAVELLSISLYILAAFLRQQEGSQEAGLKYLLIGGFASGFLLYGMALLYGATGSTSIPRITAAMGHLEGDNLLFASVGIALVLVGMAFKSSAAPFHAWTPDVYQGAPVPVVAFMSVGTKVAAIAVFLRIFVVAFSAPAVHSRWSVLLGAVSALSMIVGAVGALRQPDLKRMLAYSSIAQAGYLLLAAVAAGRPGMVSGLFYLAAYGVMTFGAFGVLTLVRERRQRWHLAGGPAGARLPAPGPRRPAGALHAVAGGPAAYGWLHGQAVRVRGGGRRGLRRPDGNRHHRVGDLPVLLPAGRRRGVHARG